MSVQGFGLQLDVLLASLLLFPVLANPCFPTLASRRIAAGKRQSRDIGVGDAGLLWLGFREKPYAGIGQCRAGTPIEDITLNGIAVLQRDRDIATIIESLFQRIA